jgi:hypothetical protein
MSEDLVRSFSKRADQIDRAVQELAADGRERTPRLVKWTVQATRKPKQHEAPETLYGRWRTEAAERGVDADTLVRQVTSRTPDRDQDWTVSDAATSRLFDRLAGPDGLTEHASTFARPEVLSPSAPAWPAPAGPSSRSWRIGSWPSGRSAWSPTGPWRSAAGRLPTCWPSRTGWLQAPLAGRASRWPRSPTRRCARPWRRI